MPTANADRAALLPLLPEERLGKLERIEPISEGLSGAAVYSVTTSSGAYILRIQGDRIDAGFFEQHVRILQRAAAARVAPAIAHVDAAARAVVSERIAGVPLPAALAEPSQRGAVVRAVIGCLRTLHGLDATGIAERDPLGYTRGVWEAARARPGFPHWAAEAEPLLAAAADALANDPRRVLSHNDLHPSNVFWDGTQPWLIDWEVAGLGHPYYDLAALSLYLRLDDAVALDVAAAHDGERLDARARAAFLALLPLPALIAGFTILGLVDDLSAWPAATRADALTISQCYDGFRTGELDLQTQRGRAQFGLALLAVAFQR